MCEGHLLYNSTQKKVIDVFPHLKNTVISWGRLHIMEVAELTERVWVQLGSDDIDLERKTGLKQLCCIQGDSNPHLD